MFYKKFIAISLVFFSVSAVFSQYTDVINSNRPGESMSAFSLGKTVFQTEPDHEVCRQFLEIAQEIEERISEGESEKTLTVNEALKEVGNG